MKVRVVGTDDRGDNHPIGVFSQGVCMEDDTLIDMASRDAILIRWAGGVWVSAAQEKTSRESQHAYIPEPFFVRLFLQGVTEDHGAT